MNHYSYNLGYDFLRPRNQIPNMEMEKTMTAIRCFLCIFSLGGLIMSRFLAATITLMTVAVLITQTDRPAEAAEVDCKDASAHLRTLQEALYHYAVIAEIPYEDKRDRTDVSPFERSCKVQHTGQMLHPADPKTIRKTDRFHKTLVSLLRSNGDAGSDDILNGQIGEYGHGRNRDRKNRLNRLYVAIDDRNGVTYIGCRYDEKTPRVFVTWEEVSDNEVPVIIVGEDSLVVERQPVTFIIPQIYVAVTQEGNLLNTIREGIKWEELGLVQLKPVDQSEVDSINAIRGTDWENLSTVITSAKDVLAESCAFESAAVIVKLISSRVSKQKDAKQVIVTGHSLGGSVTQFIGQSNIGPSGYVLRGYAFNAMGVDQSEAPCKGLESNKSLYSHYIHGDPVSSVGKFLGRIQPGTVIVSKPASNLPNWLSDIAVNPKYRHKLDTVQKALCQCLNKQGRVVEK